MTTTTNGTALTVVDKTQTASLTVYEPRSLDEAKSLATSFARSGLLSKAVDTPEKAFTLMAAGAELGLAPMAALRSLYIVEGRPVISADMMVGLVKRSPACLYWTTVDSTDTSCTVETHRRGEPQPVRRTFTKADAERAGLWGRDTWKRYPSTMLRHRAASALAREVYPDLLAGCYLPDEAEDIKAAPRVEVRPVMVQAEPLAADAVDWPARFLDAKTLVELDEVAAAFKATGINGETRKACAAAYKAQKATIEAGGEVVS